MLNISLVKSAFYWHFSVYIHTLAIFIYSHCWLDMNLCWCSDHDLVWMEGYMTLLLISREVVNCDLSLDWENTFQQIKYLKLIFYTEIQHSLLKIFWHTYIQHFYWETSFTCIWTSFFLIVEEHLFFPLHLFFFLVSIFCPVQNIFFPFFLVAFLFLGAMTLLKKHTSCLLWLAVAFCFTIVCIFEQR